MILRPLALLVLAIAGAGCATVCPPSPDVPPAHPVTAAFSPPSGLAEGQQLVRENRFAEAVDAFRKVEQAYPGTEWSGSAAYAIAVASVMPDNPQQDYAGALTAFDRFIEHYPHHDRLPEARAWRLAIKQLLDAWKESSRLHKNIEQLQELDLQQEQKRRGR